MNKTKTLTIATTAPPTRADADLGHSFADSQLYTNMNDPLLRGQAVAYPADNGLAPAGVVMDDDSTFVPNLCESWSVSPDNAVAVFSLRRGVRSHWGNELTSADVRYSVDRAFAVKASVFYFLNSFAGLPSPEYCHITGERSFELHTPNPTGVVPKLLCSPWIATLDHVAAGEHTTRRDPWSMRWMSRNSCSWGPYRIAEWNAGKDVVLEARDDYWRGRPRIRRVVVRTVPRRNDLIGMLQRGDVDIVERLLPLEIEQLRGKAGIRVISTRSTGVYQLLMNCSMKPFDDVRVRRALNFACPQARIIAEVFRGNAEPMRSPCSPLQPGFTDKFWPYEFNPDRASRLLAEAGYADGFDVDLAYSDNSPAEEAVCALLQKSLMAIKVRVRLYKLTVATFNERLYRKEHLFASKLTFTAVRDPAYWGLWYRTGTFLNYQDLRDSELDELLEQQSRILQPAERAEFSKRVQQRILDLAPAVFIAYPLITNALRDEVGGQYHINPDCLSYYWSDLDKD